MSQGPSYTDKDIKVLDEITHIRKNVSLYIGDNSNCNHLIYELLDNALDESSGGHANIIGIQIDTKTHEVTVADNGRGIPFENDIIVTLCTKLFSGAKFDKSDKGVYQICAGLHGIGIVAVTALSEWLEVEVYRDNKHAKYRFVNAKIADKKVENHTGPVPFSTQVKFKPDKKYFESLIFDIDSLKDRLNLASVHIDHLKLLLVIDGKKELIDCDANDFFKKELLDKSSDNITEIFQLSHKIKDEEVCVRFCWDFEGSVSTKLIGSVNLLRVDSGSHVNYALEMVRDIFFDFAEKEKYKIGKGDCLLGFRCFVSVFLYEPQYSSQTKEKLSVPKKILSPLFDKLTIKFKEFVLQNEELKQKLLKYFESYRHKQNAKDNIIKSGKTITRLNSTIDSKLRDCTSHSVANSEMFIVEGQSAGGGIIQCRDPKIHAILSLKGKILNIADDTKDFYKNKEIIEIINALGTGVEPEFDFESLRYGKVIIAADSDPDGCIRTSERIYIKENDILVPTILEDIILNKEKYLGKITIGFDRRQKMFVDSTIEYIFNLKEDDVYEIEFEDGKKQYFTYDHLFLTDDDKYTMVKNLLDRFVVCRGKNKKVVKITKVSTEKEKVCDIRTSTDNFVLVESDCVVHNSHIASLLLTVFLKLTPKLIDKGIIYLAQTPLYGTMERDKFIPLHSKVDVDRYSQSHPGAKITRFKGLGEFDPSQLYECLINTTNRKLIQIKSPLEPQKIFDLMTSAELKRQLV